MTPGSTRTRFALLSHRLVLLSLALSFVLGCRLLLSHWIPGKPGDFELLYSAAANLLLGQNPYPAGAPWLPYPLPAVLLVVPFTLFPVELARPVFDVLVGWAFVFGLWKYRGQFALLALLSGAYIFAVLNGQATPLMVAATLVPALGFLLAVRPNTSIAAWLYRPSWTGVVGAVVFVGVSLAIIPTWPRDWWMALPADFSAWAPPILRPFGALILVVGLRWKLPESRLLLATALLPQTGLPYELVALALIPVSYREMLVYLAGTWLAVAAATGVFPALAGLPDWATGGWMVSLCAVYLPMVYLVLRRPGCNGGPWIGRERRRPHRLPDEELKLQVTKHDDGRFTVTVTHLPSSLSTSESGPTRQSAARKAHDKLAALLARTNRLAQNDLPQPK